MKINPKFICFFKGHRWPDDPRTWRNDPTHPRSKFLGREFNPDGSPIDLTDWKSRPYSGAEKNSGELNRRATPHSPKKRNVGSAEKHLSALTFAVARNALRDTPRRWAEGTHDCEEKTSARRSFFLGQNNRLLHVSVLREAPEQMAVRIG